MFQIKKGLRYFVADAVALSGNQAVTADELRTMIALKPGDVFLESGLSLAAAAITELYRQRGFASATVKYAATETDPRRPDEGLIRPSMAVSEGPRTMVGTVRITGNAALSEAELRPLVKLAEGQPYYAPQVNADRDALIVDYLNNGFSSADVVIDPAVLERPHPGRPDLRRPGRAADDRRPHPDRRQHPYRSAGDPRRDEAQAGCAARAARIATRANAR